ncbi:PAS domain S-box protein [Nitrospirillum sp. BR 11164]|uniref:PAS domain-containing protein n=1 Tax=Nitrospirillum sp. BR 11164 TaxID=3104324 RepID=UPI002AFFE603|nr:PAS domain S-box protein [Nitrospirillum sp. BR 11164]MEA1650305.1 PAS domain S-box protein [Nitrospirillum sp. BR 11164]
MDKVKIETDGSDGHVPPTRKARVFPWLVAGVALLVAFVTGHEHAHIPVLSARTYMALAAFFLSAVLCAAIWRMILRRQEKMEAGWRRKLKEMADAQRDGATLAAIVTSSDDAIVSKTLDGLITSWNPGAERMFGYTAAEVVGRPVTALFPPELLSEEAGILDRIRRGEIVGHLDTVRCHKDGRRVDVSVTVSPVRDAHGVIVGASKIARDIGERKRAAGELERHRLDLEARWPNEPAKSPPPTACWKGR